MPVKGRETKAIIRPHLGKTDACKSINQLPQLDSRMRKKKQDEKGENTETETAEESLITFIIGFVSNGSDRRTNVVKFSHFCLKDTFRLRVTASERVTAGVYARLQSHFPLLL